MVEEEELEMITDSSSATGAVGSDSNGNLTPSDLS